MWSNQKKAPIKVTNSAKLCGRFKLIRTQHFLNKQPNPKKILTKLGLIFSKHIVFKLGMFLFTNSLI